MNVNKELETFDSVSELVDYFDNNDFSKHLENSPEVEFDVELKNERHLVQIENDISKSIREIARKENTSSSKLINSWLKEKLSAASG